MKHFFLATLPLLLLASNVVRSESMPPNLETLSAAERKAIVTGATQALNDFTQAKRKGREIPKEFWSPAISKLNPLQVTKDWTNLKIVLTKTGDSGTGLYVVTPASSYAPTHKRFAELIELSKPGDNSSGALYRYREIKQQTH